MAIIIDTREKLMLFSKYNFEIVFMNTISIIIF